MSKSKKFSERIWKDCEKFEKQLKGKTIKEVQPVDGEASGFYSDGFAIIFEDDSFIFAMSDDEGNDIGVLMYQSADNNDSSNDIHMYKH